MNKMWWIFFALLIVSVANAGSENGVYGYGYWMPRMGSEYLKIVNDNSPRTGPEKCERVYSRALNKGVLDIRYALGYFDDSTGAERIIDGVKYGISTSLDIEVYHALRKILKARCSDRSVQLCEFSESGDPDSGKVVLQKYVNLHGKKTLVRLTLTQASATSSFAQNKGSHADRQSRLTALSEDNFFNGLKTADVVFYNGHSRNGGGPDFNPPILMSNLKVNYKGYYEVKRPGIKRTMLSLSESTNKDVIVGFFSCYAKKHFYDTFMQANPKQRVILSADTIDYFDSLKASVGYLEGILRGSCGQELADTAKQIDKIKNGFQGYNIN